MNLERVVTASMQVVGHIATTCGFLDCKSILNPSVDPDGHIGMGLTLLHSLYPTTCSDHEWFVQWTVEMRANVPSQESSLYVCRFIELVILPRIVNDSSFTLDAVAPILYMGRELGGTCDAMSDDLLLSHVRTVRDAVTFVLINNHIVARGCVRSVSVYLEYIIHGPQHVACADNMVRNGMADIVRDGPSLSHLVDAWLLTEREGLLKVLTHVVTSTTYMAVVARDLVLHTPRTYTVTSRALGLLLDPITLALPYMTYDFTAMDTSDDAWKCVLDRTSRGRADPNLPWHVPNRALRA